MSNKNSKDKQNLILEWTRANRFDNAVYISEVGERIGSFSLTGVIMMPNSSSQASKPSTVPSSINPAKLNKLIFKVLLSLILLAFTALFLIILAKLPGAF